MSNSFQRARQPDQKEERRAHLLRTARALLADGASLNGLGMNELARQARMTKSNVYRYFESREAVLLAILAEEWLAWLDDMKAAAPSLPPGARVYVDSDAAVLAVTRHMARTIAARPTLGLLTAALPTVLEQNVSADVIASFKQLSLAFFGDTVAWLQTQVPAFTAEAAFGFMSDGVVAITGLYPHAHPAPQVKRVVDDNPGFAGFRHDYEADLARLFLALARARLVASGVSPPSPPPR